MRVAIVHYHLQTGGVTRVIQHAVHALRAQGKQTVVLAGEAPDPPLPELGAVRVVEGLGYDGDGAALSEGVLMQRMLAAAEDALGAPPDLWHIHNPGLGKNRSVPGALFLLAEAGQRVLVQIHDFAEDGRPANYRRLLEYPGLGDADRLSAHLYPRAGQVHYAVLNGRDEGFLAASGVPEEHRHLLPNAVWLPAAEEKRAANSGSGLPTVVTEARRLWLYPTRAIRRKNLGEFLLWAALGEEGDLYATTQGPRNPLERPVYEHWMALARELGLPVSFELAADPAVDFRALMGSAHALVSTSVAEGFGLAFLEPWLLGRPITGRDLPEITAEFRTEGIDLGNLYQRLDVPVEWFGRQLLEDKIRAGLGRVLHAYGREPAEDAVQRAWAAWCPNDTHVDMGRLDEALQEQVIRRVAGDAGARREILPARLPEPIEEPAAIEANRRAVERVYSLESYGERLLKVYGQVMASSIGPVTAASGAALLDHFLAPERLHLLRS